MKIGLVVDDGLDRLDGVQKFVVTIGEYFASKGHEVHYLAGETKRLDIANVHSLSRNLKVVFNGGNQLTMPLPSSAKKIKDLLRRENYDVLHIQMPYSPFMAGKIIKYADPETAVIGTFHILPYSYIQVLGSKLLGFVQKRTLSRFDYIYSVSEPAKNFASESFGIKSKVTPNPVDIKKLSKAKKSISNKIKIVYLGRLVKRKGCLELLKAIDYMENNNLVSQDYCLDILSDGALRPKLEAFVEKINLENKIKFRGYIDDDEKAQYLANADIAVFPSLGGESFGIVLVEAMASGAGVVLAGDNPGYRSVIDNNELLFDPKDTESLANLLAKFINNPDLRQRVHKNQTKHIKQYDVGYVGDNILKVYQSCKKSKSER